MFSEELRILDRNTTKYMIDELHEQVEAAISELNEVKKENAEKDQTIEMLKKQLAEQGK